MIKPKFRFWDKTGKVWVNPSEIEFEYENIDKEFIGIPFSLYDKDIEYCQYTGLNDINGREIFEGDIVKWVVRPLGIRYEEEMQRWEKGGRKMQEILREVKFNSPTYSCFVRNPFSPYSPGECNIIGNIYENPELLK